MLNNINAEAARINMSKKALAKKLNIAPLTLRRYIKGDAIPSDILKSMAQLFNCSTDYLLKNDDELQAG